MDSLIVFIKFALALGCVAAFIFVMLLLSSGAFPDWMILSSAGVLVALFFTASWALDKIRTSEND